MAAYNNMIRTLLLLSLLAMAACAAETGPAGQPSPGGEVNPVNGQRNSSGR